VADNQAASLAADPGRAKLGRGPSLMLRFSWIDLKCNIVFTEIAIFRCHQTGFMDPEYHRNIVAAGDPTEHS